MMIGLQFALGMVCGYFIISVCESFFHRTIQHAGEKLRRYYERTGWLGRSLLHAWYSHHVIHHFRTFQKDHVTQFSSANEKDKLDAFLERTRREDIAECKYGTSLGHNPLNYLKYVTPTALVLAFFCILGGGWFTTGLRSLFSYGQCWLNSFILTFTCLMTGSSNMVPRSSSYLHARHIFNTSRGTTGCTTATRTAITISCWGEMLF